MKFVVASGTRLCSIGNRRAMLVEAAQQLFEIDEFTDYITSALSEPVSFDTLVAMLVGEGMKTSAARRHLQHYLRFWSRRELLQVELDRMDQSTSVSGLFDIAGRAVRVSCDDEQLMDLIRDMLPPAWPAKTPASDHYVLRRFRDGFCIATPGHGAMVVRRREAVPALKGFLTDDLIANLGTDTALHGALLANQAGAIFLCGSPGAGKTTLALALTQFGFERIADDIALLHADGAISGVGFASAVKARSWNMVPGLRDSLLKHPVHLRLDGKLVRYLPIPPRPPAGNLAVTTIVLLNRKPSGAAKLLPVEPLQVFAKLVSEANNPQRRLSATQFESMLQVVNAARGLELTYSDLHEGARTLTRFHNGG